MLPKLFGRVIVPPAVIDELAEGRVRGHNLPLLDGLSWVEIQSPQTALLLPPKLGRGEQEAISMAVERHLPVLIDDRDARACAGALGLQVFGTFGVLIKGKRQGLIPLVMPLVDLLAGLGFRLDEKMYRQVRQLAGEALTGPIGQGPA